MTGLLMAMAILAQDADPIEEFKKRFEVETEKLKAGDFHRVRLDGKLLHRDFGGKPEIDIVEDEGGRSIRIRQDGKVVLKVQLPDLGKDVRLPPPVVKSAESVKLEGKCVNGQCEVTLDGKVVYRGPGSSVSSRASVETEVKDGQKVTRRFIEVLVDGKVVYRAGEGRPEPNPKKGGEEYSH